MLLVQCTSCSSLEPPRAKRTLIPFLNPPQNGHVYVAGPSSHNSLNSGLVYLHTAKKGCLPATHTLV